MICSCVSSGMGWEPMELVYVELKSDGWSAHPRCFLINLAVVRGAKAASDQPLNSTLYDYPVMAWTIDNCRMTRVFTCLGAFGASSEKGLEIYSNVPLERVGRNIAEAAVCGDVPIHTNSKNYKPQGTRPGLHKYLFRPDGARPGPMGSSFGPKWALRVRVVCIRVGARSLRGGVRDTTIIPTHETFQALP